MFGLPLGLILRIGVAIFAALFLWWVWHMVDKALEHHYADPVRAEFAAYKAEQQKKVTEIVMQQQAVAEHTEATARQKEVQREQTFAQLLADAKSVAAAGGDHAFSKPAVELFDRARDSAAGQAPGPAAKPEGAAAPPANSAEEFVVQMYQWAAICKARVAEWEIFYSELQLTIR